MTESTPQLTRSDLEATIAEAAELHALPVVHMETERVLTDPSSGAQDVAELLATDPVLASRALKMANSAHYGLSKRVGNLAQAIVVVGFQAVRNLILTVRVMESFRPGHQDAFDYPGFWAHSVATAMGASVIAERGSCPHAGDAYIIGLLHDVGKLIIVQHLPDYALTIEECVEGGMPRLMAERTVIGCDHAEIGGRVAGIWKLPDVQIDAIQNHHRVLEGSEASLTDALQLANILVQALGLGPGAAVLPEASPGLSQRLGYDESCLSEWVEPIVRRFSDGKEYLDLTGWSCPMDQP